MLFSHIKVLVGRHHLVWLLPAVSSVLDASHVDVQAGGTWK